MPETPVRKGPGPLMRGFGRLSARAAAHAPWSWRLLRRPVRKIFDSLAPGWDERTRADSAERRAPIAAALEHVRRSPRRVLDIGTGTGVGAFFLAQRYPEAEVVGIDLSAAMIERANEKATGSKTSFAVADIASYRPAEPFDLVLMLNMPPFFEQVAELVAPSGYVISIASRGPTTPYYTPAKTLERGFARRGLRTVAVQTAGEATIHIAERPPA